MNKPDIDDCPRCKRKGVLRQKLSVYVDCPVNWHNLSKSGIRSRHVQIDGAGWPSALWYCPDCGWVERQG